MTVGTASTARERLLAAASELFYAEGIHTVGIDRIIDKAGVAKASLYKTYGSKDELIRAYLAERHERQKARIARASEGLTDPRERILAIFEAQARFFAEPTFHGCAFANAAAESEPDSVAMVATRQYRGWLRDRFLELATEAGAADPALLARQLLQQYDGANAAGLDGDPIAAAGVCRDTVEALLEAALPRRRSTGRKKT
jgi:AcrR family transcriptional regulator